jgi:hypothetical protein
MKLRVKAWYVKELEFDGEIARSTMPVHVPDGHGGFYMLSVVLNKLGRGEGRDCINNRQNATRSRGRDMYRSEIPLGNPLANTGYETVYTAH